MQQTNNTQPKKGIELAREIATAQLAGMGGHLIAERCCGQYQAENNAISLRFLNEIISISLQEGIATSRTQRLPPMEEVLILRYLCQCQDIDPVGKWLTFREMPGGLQYFGPFSGRTTSRLSARFGTDKEAFEKAAQALSGERLEYGDSSFLFRLLPRLWLAVVLYLSDDEFPAESSILFDAVAAHQYTTEDFAAAGQVLSQRLLTAAK